MNQTFEFDGTPSVVTGQQAGLFGGPLYTLYKLLGAIALAGQRNERAVFWIECDDADIREADHASAVDGKDRLINLSSGEPDDGRPVAARILGAGIERVLGEVVALYPDDGAGAMTALRSAYAPGRRWVDAFAVYLDQVVGQGRAAFLDPTTPAAKQRAAPIFDRVLADPDGVDRALQAGAGSLADPAVPHRPGEIPLFVLDDDGVRRKLERREGGFVLKGEARVRTVAELRDLVGKTPERVSPGVLLRPLIQDHLLHTSHYIAGPTEIRYHAQLGPLYQLLGVKRPEVVARPRFTLLEPRARRALAKLGVPSDLVLAGEPALRAAMAASSGLDPTAPVAAATTAIEAALHALRAAIAPIEPVAMAQAADEAANKIRYQVEKLGQRAATALARRDETLAAAARRALALLLPDGKPQERVLAPIHFLARTSAEQLVRSLESAVDLEDLGRHQVIEVE